MADGAHLADHNLPRDVGDQPSFVFLDDADENEICPSTAQRGLGKRIPNGWTHAGANLNAIDPGLITSLRLSTQFLSTG